MLHILAFLYLVIQQAAQNMDMAWGLSQPLRGPSETAFFSPFEFSQ